MHCAQDFCICSGLSPEDFPDENADADYNATFTDDVDMNEIVVLDVGGDRYHVKRGCLTRLPNTRFDKDALRCGVTAVRRRPHKLDLSLQDPVKIAVS